jgi:hypothetical protein
MSDTHDPLCPSASCCPDCGCRRCECNLIVRVRADEREAAAQRVLAVEWGWFDDTQQDETIMRSDAVNAVRGDSDG